MSPEELQQIDSAVVPRFAQLATFMRAQHVPLATGLDIALVGVPFDLGCTNRAGPRHGPAQIREMSRLIRRINPSTRVEPFRLCRIADVGDAPVNPANFDESIAGITQFYVNLHAAGAVPVSAGGDHTITLPILRGIASDRPVGLVHFDAHGDTLDTLMGTKINHGTVFRRAVEEGLIDPLRAIQIGLRATLYSDDDIQFGYDAGMRIVTMDDFDALGRAGVVAEARRVVGDGPAYISFDVDGLDPVFCPGTGTPEPGGFTMRDAQVMLRGLQGLDVVGGDVVEVSPPFDPVGHTALNAASLMFEIVCLAAQAIAGRKNTSPA